MKQEKFEQLFSEILGKIGDGPESHMHLLAILAGKHNGMREAKEIIEQVTESLNAVRLMMKYLTFDLEATRRERDQLRMLLEDRDA